MSDPEMVKRTFRTSLTPKGDGRTVEGLIIPYDKPTTVADHDGTEPYKEEWLKGAFRENTKAANRVLVNFEHYGARYDDVLQSGGSIESAFGRGLELVERDANDPLATEGPGLYGSFTMFRTPAGDNALMLVKEGVVTAFSVAAKIKRSLRTPDGVVQRVKASLDWVSLAREGAFPESKILAVRTAAIEEEHEAMPTIDPALAVKLAERGLDVPEELGVDVVVLRTSYSDTTWDGAAVEASLSASDYCAVSLVDNNVPGAPKVKSECHFPVRETPGGPVVVAALRAVVGGRGQQAKFPNAAEGIAKARKLLDAAPATMVSRAADPEAAARGHLDAAIKELEGYLATEPDPEDNAAAADAISLLSDLLAKDQAEVSGSSDPGVAVGY
jgi:HK97 family phage prohead protease